MDNHDVVAFRPSTVGDYSSGEFFYVLRNLGFNVHAIDLVDMDGVMTLGDEVAAPLLSLSFGLELVWRLQ